MRFIIRSMHFINLHMKPAQESFHRPQEPVKRLTFRNSLRPSPRPSRSFHFGDENGTKDSKRKNVISIGEPALTPSLKKCPEFRRSCKQKRQRTLYAFPKFPVSSNILTSLINGRRLRVLFSCFFPSKLT